MSISTDYATIKRHTQIAETICNTYAVYGVAFDSFVLSENDTGFGIETIACSHFKIQQKGAICECGKGSERSIAWHLKQQVLINALRLKGFEVFSSRTGFRVC